MPRRRGPSWRLAVLRAITLVLDHEDSLGDRDGGGVHRMRAEKHKKNQMVVSIDVRLAGVMYQNRLAERLAREIGAIKSWNGRQVSSQPRPRDEAGRPKPSRLTSSHLPAGRQGQASLVGKMFSSESAKRPKLRSREESQLT
ncbi:hypothetical protein BDP55DRAFT_630746 [Colletotrichum godetiae]|uniref:Uncharacterized protein n=1 Tax=Colletotrichum godetiae TaxID=1209918 RepID=A0AAJ0EZI4_9PEZI|nr:uncharacterized protein BDP55DRAFT_630746 [Colletotrichum godetiae]KAK1687553.1 hypothetical protein BDP55DRAFT_630746 [Colletotrichum godetiae]